jgi:hypothetical protein
MEPRTLSCMEPLLFPVQNLTCTCTYSAFLPIRVYEGAPHISYDSRLEAQILNQWTGLLIPHSRRICKQIYIYIYNPQTICMRGKDDLYPRQQGLAHDTDRDSCSPLLYSPLLTKEPNQDSMPANETMPWDM